MSMNVNTYAHLNLDYLNLMSDGDLDMKKVMLEMLLEELPSEIKKMRPLMEDKKWEKLKDVSHKMKSTLAFVGNEEMTIANTVVEQISKDLENFEELPELITILENMTEKVMPELKIVLGGVSGLKAS